MESHRCDQVVTLKRFAKILDGNGQPGLIKDVENLKNNYSEMKEDLQSLSVSYAALVKSQLEQDVTKKISLENSAKWGKVIERSAAIFGIAGVIITAIVIFGG